MGSTKKGTLSSISEQSEFRMPRPSLATFDRLKRAFLFFLFFVRVCSLPFLFIRYNDPWARNLDDALRAFIWCLEVAISRMGPEVSKVCIVIDRNGFTQRNIDLELARAVSKVLSANYPERMLRCIVHPAGMVYYSLWNTVKWFFDPATREKVVPLMYQSALQDYIPADDLVATLGGNADVDVDPLDLPDDPYTPGMIEELSEEAKEEHAKRPLYTQTSSIEFPDVSSLDLRDDVDVSAEELERAAAATKAAEVAEKA